MVKTSRTFRLDLSGKKFGKWTVLKVSRKGNSGEIYWNCICECGTKKEIQAASLRSGASKSCGCSGKDWCRRHGMEGTPTYNVWAGMIQRCENPKAEQYPNYGGRGISVCAAWRSDFQNFYADMGKKPANKSLNRINNDGNYEPGNCQWETQKQQIRNRRVTPFLEFQGQRKALADWAEQYNIKAKIVSWRLKNGWSVESALTSPVVPAKYRRWNRDEWIPKC